MSRGMQIDQCITSHHEFSKRIHGQGKNNSPLHPWREKVKDSELNYHRQKNRRDLKVELDELNSETDTPSVNSPTKDSDAPL